MPVDTSRCVAGNGFFSSLGFVRTIMKAPLTAKTRRVRRPAKSDGMISNNNARYEAMYIMILNMVWLPSFNVIGDGAFAKVYLLANAQNSTIIYYNPIAERVQHY